MAYWNCDKGEEINQKKNKLDLVSAHIQLSAALGSVSTVKDTSGSTFSSSETSKDSGSSKDSETS